MAEQPAVDQPAVAPVGAAEAPERPEWPALTKLLLQVKVEGDERFWDKAIVARDRYASLGRQAAKNRRAGNVALAAGQEEASNALFVQWAPRIRELEAERKLAVGCTKRNFHASLDDGLEARNSNF